MKLFFFIFAFKASLTFAQSDFEVLSFNPGLQGDGQNIAAPADLAQRIQGPDYNFNSETPLANILSLGHGGEITLKVKNGSIIGGPKADFKVYENVLEFRPGSYFRELAQVSVSLNGKDFVDFPCDPENPEAVTSWCAGVWPTADGGDGFDLRIVGLPEIRYIKIRDLGDSPSFSIGTEGFDLDAVEAVHLKNL